MSRECVCVCEGVRTCVWETEVEEACSRNHLRAWAFFFFFLIYKRNKLPEYSLLEHTEDFVPRFLVPEIYLEMIALKSINRKFKEVRDLPFSESNINRDHLCLFFIFLLAYPRYTF